MKKMCQMPMDIKQHGHSVRSIQGSPARERSIYIFTSDNEKRGSNKELGG